MLNPLWNFAVVWLLHSGAPIPSELSGGAEHLCGLDANEPNDIRRRAVRSNGEGISGRLCPSDVDWFWLDLERGAWVEVVLQHDAAVRFKRPAVFPPRARKPRGRAGRREGETFTRYRVRKGGRHRIRVEGGARFGAEYRLFVRPVR